MEIPTNLSQPVQAKISWLKQHETFILVILGLLLVGIVFFKTLDHFAKSEEEKFALITKQLDMQQQENLAMQKEVLDATQTYKDTIAALTKQNQALSAAQASRNTDLATQINRDATLPNSELQARWSELAGFQLSEIAATEAGNTLSQNASVKTVQTLEHVPVITQNLKDEQQKTANLEQELGTATNVIGTQTKQVAGLQLEIEDQKKACSQQITAATAKARVSKWKWFGWGVGAGAATTIYLLSHFL